MIRRRRTSDLNRSEPGPVFAAIFVIAGWLLLGAVAMGWI